MFAQTVGAPPSCSTGPGGDLYYVDYGCFTGDNYNGGSGGLHRIAYVGADAAHRQVVAEEGEDQGRRQAAQGALPRRPSTPAPS